MSTRRIVFEKVTHRATKRWVDADGKRHTKTQTFWQTISPFNTGPYGGQKTREMILLELRKEADKWVAEPEGSAS